MRLEPRRPTENHPVETCRIQSIADRQRYRIRSDDRHFVGNLFRSTGLHARPPQASVKDVVSRILEELMPLQDLVRENPVERAADRHPEGKAADQPCSLCTGQFRQAKPVGDGRFNVPVTNFRRCPRARTALCFRFTSAPTAHRCSAWPERVWASVPSPWSDRL